MECDKVSILYSQYFTQREYYKDSRKSTRCDGLPAGEVGNEYRAEHRSRFSTVSCCMAQWAHYQRNKPTQSKRRTKVFFSEPDPVLRQRYGRLFGVLELDSLQASHLRFLHVIIEELEKAYYPQNQPHGPVGPIAAHFESTLKQLNTRFERLAAHDGVPTESDRFTFIIGVLKDQQLVFTHRGNARVLLLHAEEGRTPRLHDIIALSEKENKREERFFTSVLDGQLSGHDRVLMTTDALVDYLSPRALEELLATHAARPAAERLETLLDEAPQHLCFPVLILELESEHPAQKKSAASVEKLLKTEYTTEQILAPSFGHDLKSIGKTITTRARSLFAARAEPREEARAATRISEERLKQVGSLLWRWTQHIFKFLFRVFVTAAVLFGRGVRWAILMTMSMRKGSGDTTPSLEALRSRVRALPWKSRASLIAGVALVVLAIGSLTVIGVERALARREDAFQALVKTVEEKKAQVEVNLIYRDEDAARKLLQEVETLIATMPENRAHRREKKRELIESMYALHARVNRSVNVEKPEQFIDLTLFGPRDRALDLRSMVFQKNAVYVYGNDPLLFKVNLENRQAVSFEMPRTNIGPIATAIPNEKGTIVLIDSENRLTELNPDARTLQPIDIVFGGDAPTIRTGAIYNGRLYLVDGKNQQIYRHNTLPTGFTKGTPWLKQSINLADAQDLIIDGTLWLLFTDGSVTHLVQGNRRPFTPETMEPALTRAAKIRTTFESPYLALLDPQEKRVVILRKNDGKLMMQYTSPAFTDLRDLIVDEEHKVMYLLNGTSIDRIPLEHL